MDGMSNEGNTSVNTTTRSFDGGGQDESIANTLENQILSGIVESLTNDTGIISFSFNTQVKKAKFSRSNVVIDNMKLTKKISLLNILKIGMQVTFSVEYSNQKDGANLKASLIEVKGPVNYPQCSPEEIKCVHNKAFYGKIESLDGFSGTIAFELDNSSEKAVFSKDSVYVSDKRLKDNPVPLIVGKSVCLMVVHYSGASGCNFMAIVVQIESESELKLTRITEENVLLHHSLRYGTIKGLNEISGKIAFQADDEEKEVLFYRSSVIVNKFKLVKNVPLPSVLKVGMPVSFMIGYSSVNVFAKVVEVFEDEYKGCSYTGLLGTVTALSALSGTVTFLINNEERKALFFRKSVITGNEMINASTSLLTVLKIGLHVILEVVGFEEKNSDFIATSVAILRLKDLSCPSTIDNIENDEVLNGIIEKIGNETGIVGFHVNGKTERAIFFRNNVLINKERISKETLLSDLFHISMPVSFKVIHCTTPGFNFIAVSVEVLQENFLCHNPSVSIDQVVKHHGTLLNLTESYGIITFCIDNREEKAVMYRKELFINDSRVSKKTSLLTLLDIGMPISFTAINYTGFKECSYKVTHLEVASLKNLPLLNQNFCGIIEYVSAVGGSISFQMDSKTKKAIFNKENIHVIGKTVDSEVLLSVIKVGIPVSFRLGVARDDDCFEASAVVVEALHLQQSSNNAIVKQSSNVTSLQQPSVYSYINQKSFECHGVIKQLGKISGIAFFQLNHIEEKAVFFKRNVRIYGTKVKPCLLLSDVLKIDMEVLMTVERCKETKDYHFKASLIRIEPSSSVIEDFSANSGAEDDNTQFFHGIVQKVRNTCGMITFNMNGKRENAIVFNHSVMVNNKKLDKNTSLLSVLKCGIKVYLSVKRCAELYNCNYVAIAVGISSPGVNESLDKYGTIVALKEISGVVTFWEENKQQKARFYKKAVHINDSKLGGKVSLLSVLRVGMCVLLQVQKCKDHFKATHVSVIEDLKDTYVTKVSLSKHIACGLGIVTEIISSTVARLQFEVDEPKDGLFKLSDFFVNGQRCDDSRELSSYISKGDVYFFDASKNNRDEGDEYLITCVWQGEKPELSTLTRPYKNLTKNCQQVPSSAEGTVIALFPPQAAVVGIEVCGAVLLFVDSLSCENDTKRLTETDWIQDYLSVGDILTVELNKSRKVYCFPLVECARKIISNRPVSRQKSDLISEPSNNLVLPISFVSASNVEYPSASIPSSMSSPSRSVGRSNSPFIRNTPVSDTPNSDIGDKVFSGTIYSLTSSAGTIAVDRRNRKEIVQFTKAEVHINNQKLSSNLSLLSVLQVGMLVTFKMIPCSESENSTYKASLVDVAVETPNVDNRLLHGSVESLTSKSGIVMFNLDNKVERASFQCRNVSINKIKHPAIMMIIEVGMLASLTVKHISDSAYCKYEATVVKIEVPDNFLAAYGFETSSSPKQEVPKNNQAFCGFIYSLADTSGTIAFKMHDKNCRAIFSKNAVYINNTQKVPANVSLLRFMELGMEVVLTLESFQGIFKAKRVKVISTWLNTPEGNLSTTELSNEKKICKSLPLLNVTDLELKCTEGKITGYLSSSIGIIECNINAGNYEACFTKDVVICDQMIDNEVQKLFPLGVIVKFDGKIESFMDKQKLRILCIWHHQASKILRKKLWNFGYSLSNGGEYSGTVIEILKGDQFIVAIKNIPILVSKKYLSEPAKFVILSRSIRHGDRITVVIQRTCGKKEKYKWFASDAWRTRDASDMSVTPQKETIDLQDIIMEGKLLTVDKSSGVLLDALKRISFQSTDASLFGVWLKYVDLTQVFVPGDMFSYCICQESRLPKVWYGPQEFKDIYHQFHELFNFCCSRSTSAELVYFLVRRLGNQRGLCKQDLATLDTHGSTKLTLNQQHSILSENHSSVHSQQDSTKRKSLKVNTSPNEEVQSKCMKPVPAQQATTSKDLKPVADQKNLDSSENKKTVLQSTSCSGENTESVQQFKAVLPDAKEQFKFFNQQLTQFTCPVLTKDVKHILSQFLLSLTSKDSHSEVYREVVNKMLASVECHVKNCISGHLLNEIINDPANETFQVSEVKSTSVDQLRQSILTPSGNKTLDNVVHKLKKDTIVYVDRGTQTMSTGSVLFTHVVPG